MITKLNLIFWPLLAFEKIRGDSNGRIKVHRRQHTKKRARVCKSIVNIQQRKLRISGQNGWNKNSDINGCHKWHSLCSRVLKNRMMWKTKHLNTFSLENLLMQFCVTNCGFGVSGNPDLISITHTYREGTSDHRQWHKGEHTGIYMCRQSGMLIKYFPRKEKLLFFWGQNWPTKN